MARVHTVFVCPEQCPPPLQAEPHGATAPGVQGLSQRVQEPGGLRQPHEAGPQHNKQRTEDGQV